MSNYWIGVASRDHVRAGVEGSFCQLCHGKALPLQQLQAGDRIIYYSPRERLGSGAPVQAFTAIGEVREGGSYQVNLGNFLPYRRAVRFFPAAETPIHPLLPQLSFTRNRPSWGYAFRRGAFRIGRGDYRLITQAMNVCDGNEAWCLDCGELPIDSVTRLITFLLPSFDLTP